MTEKKQKQKADGGARYALGAARMERHASQALVPFISSQPFPRLANADRNGVDKHGPFLR